MVLEAIWALPIVIAFGFGVYSLKVAGIALRNILGVIGTIFSAFMLLLLLLDLFFPLVHH